MNAIEIYEQETGNKSTNRQISHYVEYVEWLEKFVEREYVKQEAIKAVLNMPTPIVRNLYNRK